MRWRWNVLFDDRHYEWLAARIRELPLTPVEAVSAPPLTIRDTLARKLARDSQAENPHFNVAEFLEACGFTAVGF